MLEVVGEGVDVTTLLMRLDRKVGPAEIVTGEHGKAAEHLAMGNEGKMIPNFGDWNEPSRFTGRGPNFKSFNAVDGSGDTRCTIS
jgi:hypothetical protein